MKVVPAVWVGLFALFALSAASTIRATGPAARSSAASSIPPGLPISRRAFSSRVLVSAKGRRLGKIRPNRSSRITKTCGRDRCATAADGASTLEAPATTAPAPRPRSKVRLLSDIVDVLLQQWVTNFRCGLPASNGEPCAARGAPRRTATGTLRNRVVTHRRLIRSFLASANPSATVVEGRQGLAGRHFASKGAKVRSEGPDCSSPRFAGRGRYRRAERRTSLASEELCFAPVRIGRRRFSILIDCVNSVGPTAGSRSEPERARPRRWRGPARRHPPTTIRTSAPRPPRPEC